MESFFGNGKIKSSGKILNEKKEGKWIVYDESGNILSKNKFKDGINVNGPIYQKMKEEEKEKVRKERMEKEKTRMEKEKARMEKMEHDSLRKDILRKNKYDNSSLSKGYYIDKKGTLINCFFKEGSLNSAKLIYKIDLYEKEKFLPLNDVEKFKFKENTYTVIDGIRLKACNMIGQPIYENKITTDIIKGRINLYSTSVQCLIPIDDEEYSTQTTDIFIVNKGSNGEFQEMVLKHNEFQGLIKTLVEDDEEIMKETVFEELEYNDLPSIINKYNSSRKDTAHNLSDTLDEQESSSKEKPSCPCIIRLNKKMFELNKIVKTRKECCLVMSGLSKANHIKVYTSNPNKGGKILLSKNPLGKKNIKMELSTLESGTYYMTFSEYRHVGWTTLTIK